jgi:hypothetical protein
MRARAAYISSFGTTTILVGAALLMLAVGSAIVAYKGWPGSVSGSSVESVSLAPPAHPAAALLRAAPAGRLTRAKAPGAARARRPVSAAGLVKLPRAARGSVVPGLVMVPAGGTMGLVSPIGATYPGPSRPPVKPLPPQRPDSPGPPGPATVPVSVPDPGGPPLPTAPDQIAVMVGDALASAPPVPAPRGTAGLEAPDSVAAVLARLR